MRVTIQGILRALTAPAVADRERVTSAKGRGTTEIGKGQVHLPEALQTVIAESIAAAPDVRDDVVAALREQMSLGRYAVDSQRIAEKIIAQ